MCRHSNDDILNFAREDQKPNEKFIFLTNKYRRLQISVSEKSLISSWTFQKYNDDEILQTDNYSNKSYKWVFSNGIKKLYRQNKFKEFQKQNILFKIGRQIKFTKNYETTSKAPYGLFELFAGALLGEKE